MLQNNHLQSHGMGDEQRWAAMGAMGAMGAMASGALSGAAGGRLTGTKWWVDVTSCMQPRGPEQKGKVGCSRRRIRCSGTATTRPHRPPRPDRGVTGWIVALWCRWLPSLRFAEAAVGRWLRGVASIWSAPADCSIDSFH